MIQVEFKIKKEEISKKSIKIIMKECPAALHITCFLMPTRFLIDGVDFFHDKKHPKHIYSFKKLNGYIFILYLIFIKFFFN